MVVCNQGLIVWLKIMSMISYEHGYLSGFECVAMYLSFDYREEFIGRIVN